MQSSLTSEQILSLAVDKYAIRTTRTWSSREKWLRIGQDKGIAWGEFKGKSKTPVQTMVSVTKPLFSCTCTGRKLPCSHALGLRLLYFETPHLFNHSAPPVSVSPESVSPESDENASNNWIASLIDPEIQADGAALDALQANSEPQPQNGQANEIDQARLTRIRKGLDELDMWFGDVVRNGLESVRDKKRAADWQRMARRLVDAQASELAHSVRKLATIPGSTPHWPEELLAKMGALHLLVQGFRNFENLSPEMQGDLRLAVGWLPRVDPTSSSVLADRWHVVARQQELAGKQRRHKIWLWGEESNRAALIIRILTNKQKQIEEFLPGTVLAGSLYFYPSMAPLRGEMVRGEMVRAELVRADLINQEPIGGFVAAEADRRAPKIIAQPSQPAAGYADLEEAFQAVNHALAQNPWLDYFPIMVRSAKVEQIAKAGSTKPSAQSINRGPLFNAGQPPTPRAWALTDDSGIRLPLPEKFEYGWHISALDQGSGVHIFGIWDGKIFTPFTVWQGERWLSLHILKGEL